MQQSLAPGRGGVYRATPSNRSFDADTELTSDVRSTSMRCLSTVTLAFLLCATSMSKAADIRVVYDEAADHACGQRDKGEISPQWIAQLRKVLPEFEALWAAKSPQMLARASSLTHHKFAFLPDAVRLTLCNIPSQGIDEPIVNMRYALSTFTSEPVPLRYKVDTAFHEVLHTQLRRFSAWKSKLLLQHLFEPACVRNHLHLLALQKAVLLSLGEHDALQQVVHYDSQLPSGCYRRAWAIVNETETAYEAYVAELANAT